MRSIEYVWHLASAGSMRRKAAIALFDGIPGFPPGDECKETLSLKQTSIDHPLIG